MPNTRFREYLKVTAKMSVYLKEGGGWYNCLEGMGCDILYSTKMIHNAVF